jgi:hypothetical protein
MVGPEAEREGIVRAGADMVEAMSCTSVPKLILTLNHASGAGYYAMAGQGFEPNFTFSWPTARIGVMEGDSAVQALFSVELEKLKAAGEPLPKQLQAAIDKTKSRLRKLAGRPLRRRARPLRRRHRSPGNAPNPNHGAGSNAAPPASRSAGSGNIMNDFCFICVHLRSSAAKFSYDSHR